MDRPQRSLLGAYVHFNRVFWMVLMGLALIIGAAVKGTLQPWMIVLVFIFFALVPFEWRRAMTRLNQARSNPTSETPQR
jgi:hypothetical protein